MSSSLYNLCKDQKTRKNDVVFTPKPVAIKMIDMCDINAEMKVLDPCRGNGIFYDNLPECEKNWCEITDGKDFFKETDRYDLIIGNPPFSLWSKWIDHTMKLTDKFCYIIGCLNFSDKRIRDIMDRGYGLTKFHLLKIDWWFSCAFIVVFEKNKPSIISVSPSRVLCDICNGRCKRGQKGNDMNTCPNVKK
jgi:hypothetical protein